jgi:hypothetical protein
MTNFHNLQIHQSGKNCKTQELLGNPAVSMFSYYSSNTPIEYQTHSNVVKERISIVNVYMKKKCLGFRPRKFVSNVL